MTQARYLRAFGSASIIALSATTALAGGLERTTQSVGVIFEEGSLVDFSLGSISPNVSGTSVTPPPTGTNSGDFAESYQQVGFAYKRDFSENLSFALIYDQPFGADIAYPAVTSTGYFLGGTFAEVNSHALTGVLRYRFDNNVSVLAGLRYQTLEAEAGIFIPATLTYTAESSRDAGLGYVVGAAYEKPEIALRVALTYNSEITHDWSVNENGAPSAPISTTTPQSLNLEFQSGVAQNTLVFGSVRWVDWSEFNISPVGFVGATGRPLVSYTDDYITYNLGVGRKFNEKWSGAISFTYEDAIDGFVSNLSGTNGRKGITVGATYKPGNGMEITGGINYTWLDDAVSTLSSIDPLTAASFEDNSAIGVGLRVRYRF